MFKNKITLLFLIFHYMLFSQIVINEVDSDTPSTDTKEFIELKTDTAYFSLDGYVVVLFNGSTSGGNSSYYSIDLDGYSTDINGLLLIGSNDVSPIPQLIIPTSIIQNGADAVAVYLGNSYDFLEGTLATTNNLIDALMYDTDDADDTDLMALLNITIQTNENENGHKTTESIQRNNDGTYFVGTPTPRQLNDGTGVVLNGVSFSTLQTQYEEGTSFEVSFNTEENVTSELNLTIELDNGNFDSNDFTGDTSITIPIGQNSTTTTIYLTDDTLDEGDEVLLISLNDLPAEFLILNNNLEIRVIDNDFQVAAWGTPLNPTFGEVASTQPANYYSSLDGLADTSLRQALQDIIAEEYVVREHTYTDVIEILKQADQNPENSNEVWLLYTEQGRAKLDYQTTSNNFGKWNREHTFPRSRGGFNSIEQDDNADGIDVYWETNADSLRHANSDAHALRAVDGSENSSRGNQHYGQYIGPTGNLGSFKGDVARAVLYLAVRYNGLEIVNGFPSVTGQLGDLNTLLNWHRNDPPDDFEMNRNNIIYNWQINRNPFIDLPDLVEYIWGNNVGQNWVNTTSVNDNYLSEILIFPNPTNGIISFKGIDKPTKIALYSFDGKLLQKTTLFTDSVLKNNLAKGVYFVKFILEEKSISKKIIIN
jgi:endonuclease I